MKILFFDIENIMLPAHIFNSGKPGRFAPRPAGFCADLAYILVFGYKWLGDKKAEYLITNRRSFKKNPFTDADLLEKIYEIMNEADVVITWYGSGHDFPFVTARLAQAGMFLDQGVRHIDLYRTVKKVFPLSSNRLNNVAKFFGKELKTDISPEVWARTWSGDYNALVEMAEYCAQDVEVLEQVYHSVRPIVTTMPHMGMALGYDKHCSCPSCSSTNVVKRGRRVTKFYTYQRIKCLDCGAWFAGERLRHLGRR